MIFLITSLADLKLASDAKAAALIAKTMSSSGTIGLADREHILNKQNVRNVKVAKMQQALS